MQLQNKTAIITGGAQGIGRATARLFANEGASVVIADLQETAGRQVADEIQSSGGRALFQHANVSLAEDCRRVADAAIGEFGAVHVLFNNAGIIRRASVLE